MFIGKFCHYLYTCLFGDPKKYEKLSSTKQTNQIAQKIFSYNRDQMQMLRSLQTTEVISIRKSLENTYLVAVRDKLQNLSSENFRTKAPNILAEFKKNIKELLSENFISIDLEPNLDALIENLKNKFHDVDESQLKSLLKKLNTQITATETNAFAIQFINEQESDDKRPSKHLPISQAEYDLKIFDEITSLSAPTETLSKQSTPLELVTALIQEIYLAIEQLPSPETSEEPSQLRIFENFQLQFSNMLSSEGSELNLAEATIQSKLLKGKMGQDLFIKKEMENTKSELGKSLRKIEKILVEIIEYKPAGSNLHQPLQPEMKPLDEETHEV